MAVIIPYYQRAPGILRRALDGVWSQDLPSNIALRVVVVDDASPHPASAEITTPHPEITVLNQPNGGPGSARNRGLDLVRSWGDVDVVAFLDSDDIWHSDHLAHALSVLAEGYDFFCCDNARPGSFARFSEDAPALRNAGAALADKGIVLSKDPIVRGFPSHSIEDDIVTGYISHTSTVVLRAETVRSIRFDVDLRHASEDRMFWIAVACSGARIAISWACNVTCGRGVNMFFSAYDWNAPATIDRLGSQLLFAEKLRRRADLTALRAEFANRRARITRRAYCFLFVRLLLKRRAPPLGSFRRLLRIDPILPLRMPGLFLAVFFSGRRQALDI
ncbi:MAG: glycosyltransferase family A protein [Pseudomonadota bacterium]